MTKQTKGDITFENYWGGAMASPAEHIELVKKGTVQLAQTHQWYTPGKFPIGHFEYVFPFGPINYELVAKSMRQMRTEFPEFARDEAKENVIILTTPPGGVYTMLAKKPIKTVDEFQGRESGPDRAILRKMASPGGAGRRPSGGRAVRPASSGVTIGQHRPIRFDVCLQARRTGEIPPAAST